MNFTKNDLDKAIKVDTPKNTANPFIDFMAVLPKGFKLNTLYKINDKYFLYVPDDRRYQVVKSIHLLREIKSSLINARAFEDTTITDKNNLTKKTVFVEFKK